MLIQSTTLFSIDILSIKHNGGSMPTKVIMPQLGESVQEGTISKWLKAEGDQVNEFDPLLEINTDKVDTEIPSPTSGILLKILVAEGDTVQVGNELAWIGEPGESISERDSDDHKTIPAKKVSPIEEAPAKKDVGEGPQSNQQAHPEDAPLYPGRKGTLGFISPVVAKIASENQVDLTKIKGTGKGGRITKKDILAFLEQSQKDFPTALPESTPTRIETVPERQEPTSPSTIPSPFTKPKEILPLTPVRRAIADHMVLSKHTSPHVTTVMEANLTQVISHRQAKKESFSHQGIKLTFTPYFAAATVLALTAFPVVNSSWTDEGIIIHPNINLGIATSLGQDGLIVPVIKNADGLSLLGLARAINDLAFRARSRKLNPDEVQGGTFTITNHGISGSLFASPIINQPQSGILGVGVIQKRVVVVKDDLGGDTIAIRPMVYISLTFDHRILDGAIADHFLAKLIELLENWRSE
jgi:2-oxoglutarate dehydrogenase dihydrolipoamide succinyltransferase (E2 component)